VRRRFAAALKKLPPKTRRRVIGRLRAAAGAARVSGAVRGATAMVGWEGLTVGGPQLMVGGPQLMVGASIMVGCPLESVAGPLTP
jgi:hypothetical protein